MVLLIRDVFTFTFIQVFPFQIFRIPYHIHFQKSRRAHWCCCCVHGCCGVLCCRGGVHKYPWKLALWFPYQRSWKNTSTTWHTTTRDEILPSSIQPFDSVFCCLCLSLVSSCLEKIRFRTKKLRFRTKLLRFRTKFHYDFAPKNYDFAPNLPDQIFMISHQIYYDFAPILIWFCTNYHPTFHYFGLG